MALPLAGTAAKAARQVYRDAKGRFISKAKYELLQRRDPLTGRFLSKKAAARIPDRRKTENYLRSILGAPPRGKSWFAIAARYPERFEDFLAGLDD